jgi:hypothetical protein
MKLSIWMITILANFGRFSLNILQNFLKPVENFCR